VAGFEDVLQLYLQPSALETDPDFARGMFLRDLNRRHLLGTSLRNQSLQQDRANFDRDLSARGAEAQRTFRNLTPKEQKYHPPGNQSQYMIDAILRDNAIQTYDRQAPQLREADRALRT